MRLTPRASEYKPVVALLESDAYDSAEKLAKDIVKVVFEQLLERDWYAHAWREGPGGLVLAWGPLPSETEVERFAKATHIGGEHIAVRLFSPARQARVDAEHVKAGEPVFCAWCGHPSGTHENAGYGGKCAQRNCTCTKIQKEAA